jgi:tetratricopeptide (TPR) repeat protein
MLGRIFATIAPGHFHMPSRNPTARSVLTFAASAWLVCSLLYLGGGCASAPAAKSDAALDSYVKGVMAYQKGDTDKAMVNLQDAVSKKDDLVMARSMLGDLYRSKSDYESAREQYEVVAALDPYDYIHHYHLGLAYQFLKRFQDAAVSYLKALDLKPDDAASNMYLGTVFLTIATDGAASMSPDDAAKLRKKAVLYAQRAADLDPKSAAALANLAVVLDADKQYAKAEVAYRKALDLDSSQTLVQLYLGENLIQQKKYSDARSVLSELVKNQDLPEYRNRLGDAYAGEKNYAEALNQYNAALKLNANYFPALNKMSEVYIVQYKEGLSLDDGKRKAALDAWQRSLGINRQQPDIMLKVQEWAKAPMFNAEH